MFIEIFEHDVFVTNEARLSPCTTRLHMLVVLALRPSVFTVFADFGFPWTNLIMSGKELWLDHLVAHGTLFFLVELFLTKWYVYIVLFLIFYIDHFGALFALAYVTTTVRFVKIYAINRERLVAVGTLLSLRLDFHLQLLFKLQTISIN
jgi:hypothetical protein